MPLPPANDPAIEAIADRVRAVIARQPGPPLESIADELGVPLGSLRRLMEDKGRLIHTPFLIDVIAALVHEMGLDPKWLLTGRYDGAMHRRALSLGEDRTSNGARKLREFIEEQFRRSA